MKITTKKIFIILMMLFMLGYASYSNIIARATNSLSRYILLGGILLFAVIANSDKNLLLKIPSKVPPYMLCWLLMGIFALSGFARVKFGSLQIVICILFAFVSGSNDKWIDTALQIAKFLLFVFVFFTFFFFVFPRLYSIVTGFYGFIPDGTSRGAYPYRAGIASHYSINALNISILLVIVAVKYISDNGITLKVHKESAFDFILIMLSFVALLMTSKRGVLVWSILAIGIFYILLNKGKVGNIVKILLIAFVLLGVLTILAENSQIIARVFDRFRVVGTSEDNSSAQRVAMWKLALSYFKQSPLFGTGFWTYRGFYSENLSAEYSINGKHTSIDAHNVYIQVLCETGIVGFMIYILAVGFLLYRTIILLWSSENKPKARQYLSLSLALQLFYILYSFSGNCFYDMTFFYYALAMGITYSVETRMKNESRQSKLPTSRSTIRELYHSDDMNGTVREKIYYENSDIDLS